MKGQLDLFLAILVTYKDDREAPALTGSPPGRYLFPDAGGLTMAPYECSFLSPTWTGLGFRRSGVGWGRDWDKSTDCSVEKS